MQVIRRAVFRAASSPSTTVLAKSRTISNNATPFLRPRTQIVLTQAFSRRFTSDDAEKHPGVSATGEETGAVRSAIDSAKEMASNAAETVSEVISGNSAPFRRDSGRDSGRQSRTPSTFAPREMEPSTGIYVGNLLFDVTAEDLRREFGQYGTISSTTIAADPRGLSKGFGYVQYEDIEHAKAAIEAKNQSVFEGRRIVVNYMAKKNSRGGEKNPPSKTLFIGNLAFEMSDADLNKMFREIRNVIDVRVAIDRRTGQPRGFAHADFVDVESAVKGLEALQGREIYGRPLRVDFSGATRDRHPVSRSASSDVEEQY